MPRIPNSDFLPQTGRLARAANGRARASRIDTGVREGDSVTPYYDPMIAKLIAHGRDARRGDQALE